MGAVREDGWGCHGAQPSPNGSTGWHRWPQGWRGDGERPAGPTGGTGTASILPAPRVLCPPGRCSLLLNFGGAGAQQELLIEGGRGRGRDAGAAPCAPGTSGAVRRRARGPMHFL